MLHKREIEESKKDAQIARDLYDFITTSGKQYTKEWEAGWKSSDKSPILDYQKAFPETTGQKIIKCLFAVSTTLRLIEKNILIDIYQNNLREFSNLSTGMKQIEILLSKGHSIENIEKSKRGELFLAGQFENVRAALKIFKDYKQDQTTIYTKIGDFFFDTCMNDTAINLYDKALKSKDPTNLKIAKERFSNAIRQEGYDIAISTAALGFDCLIFLTASAQVGGGAIWLVGRMSTGFAKASTALGPYVYHSTNRLKEVLESGVLKPSYRQMFDGLWTTLKPQFSYGKYAIEIPIERVAGGQLTRVPTLGTALCIRSLNPVPLKGCNILVKSKQYLSEVYGILDRLGLPREMVKTTGL